MFRISWGQLFTNSFSTSDGTLPGPGTCSSLISQLFAVPVARTAGPLWHQLTEVRWLYPHDLGRARTQCSSFCQLPWTCNQVSVRVYHDQLVYLFSVHVPCLSIKQLHLRSVMSSVHQYTALFKTCLLVRQRGTTCTVDEVQHVFDNFFFCAADVQALPPH